MKSSGFSYAGAWVIAVVLFAQCTQPKEKEVQPTQIPGTPVSLVPAKDFELVPEMGGFKHTSSAASIMVIEIPKPYNVMVAEVSAEKMALQHMTLLSKDTLSVMGVHGLLYKTSRLTQGFTFKQWVLLLPHQGHALTVNGTYILEDEATLSEPIKQAVLSARVTESTPNTSLLKFTLQADSLKLARILEGPSVIYTQSGTWNESSIFDLSFFAGPSSRYGTLDETQEFTLGQLKQVCTDCEVIKNGINPITIDSLKGYEVLALSKDSAGVVKRLKYQVVLFDSTRYFLMVGTSTKNSPHRIDMFKNISRSFRRKS